MKRARDWIVLIVMVAAFVFSLAMIRRMVGYASPWFGLMLMFDVLGTVAMARPLYLPRLPGFLRTTYAWETASCKALGVRAFGSLLRGTILRYLNPMVYLGRLHDVGAVFAQIESAEVAHYLAAIVLLPYIVLACRDGQWIALALLVAAQLAFNVYPILHLRWTRIRLGSLQRHGTARSRWAGS
jgi:Glycosyl-4,4'-diaponeurosporenoate acyltransferase